MVLRAVDCIHEAEEEEDVTQTDAARRVVRGAATRAAWERTRYMTGEQAGNDYE
jgi:hypothetical protein